MKRYEAYKDSGVDWIGDIPEHWECKRLGSWFTERREKVSDKDFEPLSVTKNGIVPQLETAAKSNDGDNRKGVRSGDFVINSRSDRKGSSGLAKMDGSVSLINIIMKPRNINGYFSEFLLKSSSFIEEFYRNGHGIVADLWTTRFEDMKFINIPVPPFAEQTAIAEFLDAKTAKIDQTIGIRQKEIELLKERRQILIQQAVTKGLDATVPMKDSGVDWIGEIPEHWEVRKIKFCGRIKIGESVINNLLNETGQYEVFGGNGNMGFYDKFNVDGDNIIIGRVGAYCGNVRLINEKKWISDNALILKLFNKKLYDYISKALEIGDLNKLNMSNAQPLITGTKVMNFFIPFPNNSEREQIVLRIKLIEEKICKAITLKEQEIEKLKEYKTVLIDNVVTGKVRVS